MQDPAPKESPDADQSEQSLSDAPLPDPERSTMSRRGVAVIVAFGILALPVGYLVTHKAADHAVAAQAVSSPGTSIAALEAAVGSNPSEDNRINLSQAYINGNMPGQAVPVLQAVVAANPNSKAGWNNLCVAHTMQQDYKPALAECARALQIDPGFQLARNNQKWAQDENDKAMKTMAEMEQTSPAQRDSNFYLTEGMLFLHVGNNERALGAWQRELEIDPKNAIAMNNIGTAYMNLKQPQTAAQWFRKAMATDPSLQLAQNNLRWAEGEIAMTK